MILETLAADKLTLCRRLIGNIQGITDALSILDKDGQNAEQLVLHRLDELLEERAKLLDAAGRCQARLDAAIQRGEPDTPEYASLAAELESAGQTLIKQDSECRKHFEALRADLMVKLKDNNQLLKSMGAYKLDRNDYIANVSSRFNVKV